MRLLSKLLAVASAAATVATLTAGPALADPPSGTTPNPTDAVGVGSDTSQYLFDQFSNDYNKKNSKASTKLYSWDATNPTTGAEGDQIETKATCSTIARPNGGNAGITALEANTADPSSPDNDCIDYARTASPRSSSNPACSTGGICFVSLAGDAVTWATRTAAAGGTDAPANLTVAQLTSIFECKTTNWDKVGGQNAPIQAFLPQTSAATRTFWLLALGGGTTPITPGACVNDENNTLEQNEGVNPVLNSAEAIFIYSVGDYIAQVYHSAACINSDCSPNGSGQVCTPATGQNQYGCNESGVLGLNTIAGSKPTTPWPLTPSSTNVKINASFDLLFQRTLYDVVRYDPNTSDHIPGGESGSPGGINLETFFGASGWLCTNATAKKDITNYGFLSKWKLSTCGAVS